MKLGKFLFALCACAFISTGSVSAQTDELDAYVDSVIQAELEAINPSIMLGCQASIPNTTCGCSATGAGSCTCTGTGSATVCTCTDSSGTMTCKLVGGACNCTSTAPPTTTPRPRNPRTHDSVSLKLR